MITGFRRSSLFVPGDSRKMILKAAGLAADVLLLNLEDGVSLSNKGEARNNVVDALRSQNFGRKETIVRVNSLRSETGKRDLAALVPAKPDGICLPKVDSAQEIQAAKENIKGSLMLSLESSSSRMMNLARQEIYFGRQFGMSEMLRSLDVVRPAHLQELAEELLDRNPTALAALGRTSRFHADRRSLRF